MAEAKKSGKFEGFSDEERAAMKEHAQELKTTARRASKPTKADAEKEVLEKIEGFPEPDRAMAERVHAIVMAAAPHLTPRLWYGQPAYSKDGKIICFFQPASKFKTRYSTLGFNEAANLDDGPMWPTAFAVDELTPAAEARIEELVERAAS